MGLLGWHRNLPQNRQPRVRASLFLGRTFGALLRPLQLCNPKVHLAAFPVRLSGQVFRASFLPIRESFIDSQSSLIG